MSMLWKAAKKSKKNTNGKSGKFRKARTSRSRSNLRRMLRCEDLESRQLLNADMGWVKPFGDSGFDAVYEVAVDADDNVYSVARFVGSVDLDPDETYSDNRDLVSVPLTAYAFAITKFDPEGKLLWSHVAEGQDGSLPGTQSSTPRDIQVQDGSVYIHGSLNDQWDFDPYDPATDSQRDQFGSGAGSYLLKLDAATGEFRWVNGFGLSASANSDDDSLAVAPDGSAYVSLILREGARIGSEILPAQSSTNTRGIVSIASSGEVLGYEQLLGSNYLQTPALEFVAPTSDPSSWRLYMSAGFQGELSVNGSILATTPNNDRDVYWASMTTDFQIEQVNQYSLPLNQYTSYLAASDTGIYIAGELNIDASDNTGSSIIGDDFLFRLDSGGNLVASQSFGDELSSMSIYSVDALVDGVLIGGVFRDSVDFAGEVLTSLDGTSDGFIAELTPNLDATTARQYGGTGNDLVRDIVLREDGLIAIAGSFEESATIPVAGGITSAGNDDGYMAVLNLDENDSGNSAPISLSDQYTFPNRESEVSAEDGLLANDLDPDGDSVSIELLSQPANGTLQLSQDGSFTYTPNPGFLGRDQFTYRISDGELASEPATVAVDVFEEIVLFEDSFEEGMWNGKWVGDDYGVWFRSSQRATDGNFSAEADGFAYYDSLTVAGSFDLSNFEEATLSFDWLIESGFDSGEWLRVEFFDGEDWSAAPLGYIRGNDDPENTWIAREFELSSRYLVDGFRFRFTADVSNSREDGNVDNVRLIGLQKNDSNLPPEAADDAATTSEDQSLTIDVLANDSDPEGNALTIASVTQPNAGTAAIVGGQIQYTPDANFNGSDSFTYTITDIGGKSATATVDVTITPVNDAPISDGDSVTTAEDTPVTINVLANDSDIDGDELTVVTANQGANGSVVINADQTVTYTPNTGFFGSDSFSYTITDGNGETSTSEVLVTVDEQNDPPAANDDAVTTNEDADVLVNVLGNDSDSDGDALAIQSITQPSHGSTTIVGQQVRYSPNANFNGSDSFTYTIVDTAGNQATARVNVTVTSVNDAPVASSESYVLDQDTTLNIDAPGVLGNDSDVDGDALTAALVAGPASGSLTLNADGSFSYTPDAGYVGNDSFSYQAVDSAGAVSAPATVSLQVDAVATGPKLSHGDIVNVGSDWQTVMLAKSYDSAVIVATPRYNDDSGPGVVRISNVTATSFDVRVDNVGTSAFDGGIHFIAMEEGVYDVPGEYKLEAVKVDASTTSRRSGWQINTHSYAQSYNNPVVVGQVMSANDEDWSTFWSSSSSRTSPANSGSLNIGKHVAEDTDTTRATETLGYFVIESTSGGTIDGLNFSAGVGSDTIRGVGNGTYQYNSVLPSGATTAVLSSAGMDGNDGGWAVLRGDTPLAFNNINLSIDEDQYRDSERNHTTEQVAYFVIGGMAGEGEASERATPKITIHDPLDVNGDGFTSPIDALQVINALNAKSRMPQTLEEGDNALDTNGDGHVSPIDALLVINKLNRGNPEPGENDPADSIIDGFFADLDDEEDDLIMLGLI